MKQLKLNWGKKTLLGGITALAVWMMILVGAWSSPTPAVYAATPVPQEKAKILLEFMLQRQLLGLTGQQQHLDLARQNITITQSFLDQLKNTGEDVSALQTALDTFATQIEAAQTSHDATKQILDAKTGFDTNGKVTDVAQARDTLKNARESMQESSKILRQAVKEFRQAMQAFRQAHNPNKPGNDEGTDDEEPIP